MSDNQLLTLIYSNIDNYVFEVWNKIKKFFSDMRCDAIRKGKRREKKKQGNYHAIVLIRGLISVLTFISFLFRRFFVRSFLSDPRLVTNYINHVIRAYLKERKTLP